MIPYSPMFLYRLFSPRVASCLLLWAGCLTLGACSQSSAAEQFPKTPSYAISQKARSSLGDALRPEIRSHAGLSGFRILTTGSESFSARLALIQAAEKTLDIQYYILNDDVTAHLLLEAIVRAAQRGVRIRFLIDDMGGMGDADTTLAVLDGFKNIETRIFNPMTTRDDGVMGHILKYTTDLSAMNRRMHNKSLIADNQMAILGGRNLGDEYFEENTDMTFRDIDILIAGPITADISKSFDNYWNNENAQPIRRIELPERDEIARIRADLANEWDEVQHTEKGKKLLTSKLHERLKDADVRLTWAKAELAVDAPQKVDVAPEDTTSRPMNRLERLVENATHEFIAVSPYFVPREEGLQWIKNILARGVRVKLLTNSLASTDVVAVHTGYAPYRKELLAAGTELYEMKPTGGKRPRQRLLGSSAPAHASLHAKVYVVDAKEVMIGSFNLDPRSIELNTEIALLIHSKELAQQMIVMFDDVTSPENSYRLSLDADENIVWKTREKKGEKIYRRDPKAGLWRNVQSDIIGLLPIEEHL